MMNKRRIVPLVVLLLLVTPFLGLIEIPMAEAIPDPVVIDTVDYYTFDWEQWWNEHTPLFTWKATPKNEDLQVITEYPFPNTQKVTLNLTASLKATYTIVFKIDLSVVKWSAGENSVNLEYDGFTVLFDFSDVEDMKLQHSHNIQGAKFIFTIQKSMEKGENLFVDPSVVIDTCEGDDATGYANQRKLVRTSVGRLYAVYYKKLGEAYQIYVKESLDDGLTWINEVRISTHDGMIDALQLYPSIAVDSNDYLHVVWHGAATGYFFHLQIWYVNYTDSWSTPVRISIYGDMGDYAQYIPSIAVDSNDYLHVVWRGGATGYFPDQVWHTKYTDSWATPIVISTYDGMDASIQSRPGISVDSNDHLHVVWFGLATGFATNEIWYANYNTSWQTPVRISTYSGMEGKSQIAPSIATDSSNYIHVVWYGRATGFPATEIWYTKYMDMWSSPLHISTYEGMDILGQSLPTIGVGLYDYIHVFWAGKATGYTDYVVPWHNFYTTSWQEPICVQPTVTARSWYLNLRWSFYNYIGKSLDYVWTEGTSSPYDIVFDSIPTVVAGIHNMDGCGDWVHEGRKQYEFYINVTSILDVGSEISAGMGFYDDAGDWYNFYYSNETGRITLVSPEDGISASLKDVETGDHWVYINFTVLFNPAIADTLDVDLYARRHTPNLGDSGWYVHSADYFNIYNLGGFATLTASGWANRTAGGDVFEIYAADTRTKNMIPVDGFDVRKNPLRTGGWHGLYSYRWYTEPGDEEALLDDLAKWIAFIPSRNENYTIYPTNRLPGGAPATAVTYNSYPFGLRIYDNPRSLSRYMFIERKFPRVITSATGELVMVQVFAMTPSTTGTTGRILVSDIGLYPYYAEGGAARKVAVNFIFAGNGSMRAANGAGWNTLQAYVGWQWYNITFVLNVTAQTFDTYVDDVLKGDDYAFDDTVSSINVVTLAQNYWAPVGNHTDVYFDDVRVWTDWDGDYGGDAKATALFRHLQHWSMDWGFGVEEGKEFVQGATHTPANPNDDYSNHGFVELGMDICLNETWENNFLVARINITDGDVNINKNCWVENTITWRQNGTLIKTDVLYGLFEGYKFGAAPGAKDVTSWYWDMWFNRMNNTVGGRLNTKYFGMSEKSVGYIYWGTNWKPMDDVTQSSCFVDLVDSSGNLHSIKEVSLVRPWVRVYRTNESTFHYSIQDIDASEFSTTDETMSGIDTPPVKDTVSIKTAIGGIGVFLASAFRKVMEDWGDVLLMRLTSVGGVIIGLVDFIGGMIGYPKVMSNMVSWIGNSWGYFITVLNELFLFQLIGLVFGIVTDIFGHFIWWLTSMITMFTDIFTIVWAIIDGTYTGVGVLQDMWALMNWPVLVEAMPIFIAIAWFDSLDKRWRANGRQGWFGFFFGDIRILTEITSFIVFLAGRIYDWTVTTITRIMLILKR